MAVVMGVEHNRHAMAPKPSPRLYLSADVGGTHARVGLVLAGTLDEPARVLHYGQYVGAEHASLDDILEHYLAARREEGMDLHGMADAVIACAGYVLNDTVVNTNLPWTISTAAIRQRLGLRRVEVINDFEALAYALPDVDPTHAVTLIGRTTHRRNYRREPKVVMGPGTGLGCAVLLPGPRGLQVLATEAGQIGFSPGNAREAAILALLAEGREYVAVEHFLSGPGLLNIYRAIAKLEGREATLATPADVSRHAVAGTDPSALEALHVLCGVLGSLAADLAILYGARGGIYLAGGILPKLADFIRGSTMRERFYRRGVMRALLEEVPVILIEHGQLGVLGAATWMAGKP